MNNAQKGISKTSKVLSLILAAGCVLSALATILFVVGIAILNFANSTTTLSLQNAFSTPTLVGTVETPSVQTLTVWFLFAILQLVLFFVLFSLLYRIFLDINTNGTPFENRQVARLKQVAVLVLTLCVSTTVMDSIGYSLRYGAMTLKINLLWYVIAIVIYCLALIFEYGAQLQKQSDETL